MLKIDMISMDEEYDYRTKMIVTHKGKQIAEHWDGGEPEDNSFYRDWYWVQTLLEKVYKLGVLDGAQNMRGNG